MRFPGIFYAVLAGLGVAWANAGLSPKKCPNSCSEVVKCSVLGVVWAKGALMPKMRPK